MIEKQKNPTEVLVAGITPYFLERDVFWFEENFEKLLKARKFQEYFAENLIYLKENQEIKIFSLLKKLEELGYERVERVTEIGEFSQKGGIVEIFPINSKKPFRLDFLGNKIEKIEFLDLELKDEKSAKEFLKKKLRAQKIFSDLSGIKKGEYIVHSDHGIGIFLGVVKIPSEEVQKISHQFHNIKTPFRKIFPEAPEIKKENKFYLIEYAEGDKLYVPVGLERKLSRYVGFTEPKLSKLGSPLWQRNKRKVKEEAIKIAKELLEIYAKRKVATRPPYPPDDEFEKQLKATFEYTETPDQIKAEEDIKKDLESTKPMDRIICGDVGFGKTEIALRAMVKVAKTGNPAVIICPTTILANQHFENFKKRLKNLPFNIALLTRLQSKKEQKKIISKIKEGKIDIIVGTHRLLSDDVAQYLFKKRGILVIDDEHKFGVKQKEKLKKLRSEIDVISLSATPIPRTLYMALSSLKDISLIKTPPKGRMPVKTFVLPFSLKTIQKAIKKEIERNGQVYYLHNRIETIEKTKEMVKKLVPQAKIEICHGKKKEKELIKIMEKLQRKEINVLISTTIIENGLDFPNVNTLIVDDASKLGLSQAHQLRGRIGRSHIKAYAYFFHNKTLSQKAKLRLDALKNSQELGAGYKIALKDLEIRGAGNILGKEQSGNINRVGLNLYCQMLSEAIEKLK